MKKIYPSIIIVIVFGFLMVAQMVLHGQKLTANKIEDKAELFTVFESEYSKLAIETTKGNKLKLAENKSPIVILNFWASWCKPCVKEFASLNKLIEQYPDKIKVIGINQDDETPAKKIKKAEAEYGLKFESTIDKGGKIASDLNIKKIPASLVYHDGKIIHFSNEEFDFMSDEFIAKIKSKLKI